jgi:putative ABC transport system substrate-binding protein
VRLPTHYALREIVEDFGLMAYSANTPISSAAREPFSPGISWAADLPVEQPKHVDFVVNLKTAGIEGYAIPPALLLRTDEVYR